MGLDQYVFFLEKSEDNGEVDIGRYNFKYTENTFFYWRKHPDLEGWMEKLYYSKGGTSDKFNNDTLLLTKEDIVQLAKDTVNDKMPKTEGFFFGESDEESKRQTILFIAKALKELEKGEYDLYYTSSW